MAEQPPIPRATTALVMNDMINANLHTGNPQRDRLFEESGIIQNTARLVAALRPQGVPIFWIRVERRADRADVADVLTDAFLASGRKIAPPIVRGTREAANVDELPVQPEDWEILKPRLNPFLGTDLDLKLRARKVDTILLGGYSTNSGVENCVRMARDLGYNVVLLSDCTWNIDTALHEFSITRIMPMFARVMTSEQALSLLK